MRVAEVAVIGIGRMGAAMAAKLVDAGHHVRAWNRTPGPAQALAQQAKVVLAPTPGAAAAGCDLVISMLSAGSVTEAVLLDDEFLDQLQPGTLVCDMATSGIATAAALDARLRARGIAFIDAPVSGSVPSVASGQLLVMASGVQSEVQQAEPILLAFAKRVAYLGPAGNGQGMKLAVNLVVHALNAAVAEALTLAAAAGVPAEAAYDVLMDSSVAAPFVVYKRQAFLDPQAPVAMSLELTKKDLGLISDFAAAQGVPATVIDAVRAEVTAACDAGFASQDMAALARFLADAVQGPASPAPGEGPQA